MKFLFRIIIFLTLIVGICIISCPKHDDHTEALKQEVKSYFDDEFANDTEDDDGLAFLASSLCSGISNAVLVNKLIVDNYFLFSIGRIELDGENNVVSIGILNHVFTDIPEEVEEKLETLQP